MNVKKTLFHGSIMRRLIGQALALTALTIVVLASLSLLIARSLVGQSIRSEAATLSAVAEESVEKSLRYARERAMLLSAHQDVQAMVARGGAEDPERVWELLLGDSDASLPVIGFSLDDGRKNVVRVGRVVPVPSPASAGTVVRPSVTREGMTVFDVRTPVRNAGKTVGMLHMRYDASAVMAKLASLSLSLGKTGEVMVSFLNGSGAYVFRPSTDARRFSLLPLAKEADTPTMRALEGAEGVADMTDDEGVGVIAAYRYLPDIGWGFAMTVERAEAFAQIAALSRLIVLIGACLLLLAAVAGVALSRTITQPLRTLADEVKGLRPGAWGIERTVQTGDEVEVLDTVVVDMATRLKKIYENMEGVIRERTQELAQQYARDSAILGNIEYAVIAVDDKGVVTDTNPAATGLLGMQASDMKGKNVGEVVPFRAHQGNAAEGEHPVLSAMHANASRHSSANAHWNVQKADQTLVPVSYSVSPLEEKGRVFGAILVLQDVSEERRLDYLKSEFITLASHQLRTPLSALRWYVELMGEASERLTDDEKGYVREMGVSLKRMAKLLDSLLRASQMEEGGLGVSLSDVDINQLISETDEDFRSIAQEHGISFSVSLPDAPVIAKTDATLLRIVLQNLLSNATKYTPEGSHITLTLDSQDGFFEILVTDEGMGIPLAEQKRVFQKFFRAKNVRQMDTDGNGLGLYITKSIVERLGGTIEFKSEEGKGTTFTVEFPLKQAL